MSRIDGLVAVFTVMVLVGVSLVLVWWVFRFKVALRVVVFVYLLFAGW